MKTKQVASGHSYTYKPPSDRWLKVFAKFELFLVFAGFIQAIGVWLLAVKSYFYEYVFATIIYELLLK